MLMEKCTSYSLSSPLETYIKCPSFINTNKYNKLSLGFSEENNENQKNSLPFKYEIPVYINESLIQSISKPNDVFKWTSNSNIMDKYSIRAQKDSDSSDSDELSHQKGQEDQKANVTLQNYNKDIQKDYTKSANMIEDLLVKQMSNLSVKQKEVDIMLMKSQIDSQGWDFALRNITNASHVRMNILHSQIQFKISQAYKSLLPKTFELFEEEFDPDILYLRDSTSPKHRPISVSLESYPCLTNDDKLRIENILFDGSRNDIISQGFGLNIKRLDLHTLNDVNWLNDEVINFYLNMIVDRSESCHKSTTNSNNINLPITRDQKNEMSNCKYGAQIEYPTCFTFNTFFFTQLTNKGYVSVKRWTKKVDIFSKELIFIPVHIGAHWCMAIIDFKYKVIIYFDSLYTDPHENHLQLLKNYLEEESLDKKKIAFDMTDWKLINARNAPQQYNGSDCGMFAIKYAEFISRRENFTFTQANMEYFRKRLMLEISDKTFYNTSQTASTGNKE